MKRIFLIFFVLVATQTYAQHTNIYTDAERLFYEGKELCLKKKYAASSDLLEQYLATNNQWLSETVQEARYFLAVDAYELRQETAYKLLSRYFEEYPYSPFFDQTCLMLGTLTFEKRAFKEAIIWFARVDVSHLDASDAQDYHFRYAYTLLQLRDYANARYHFSQLIGTGSRYESAATYYYAYTEYTQKHYEKALEGFLKVKDNPEYQSFVPYYLVQIYYYQQRYDELMPLAEELLKKNPKNSNNLEIYRILGECYYHNKDYGKTVEYLSRYRKEATKFVRNEMYLLGISYYNIGKYLEAIDCLSKATTKGDAMTQNAYLHIGLSNLKLNEKNHARLAFEQAAKLDYDADVAEEALYNYALVTYELSYSPFNESVKAFEQFLNKYPKSKYSDQVYDYLVNVYLTTNNYGAAYESMQKIKKPSARIQEAKQRVLYNMGVDALAEKNYDKAIDLFTQSLDFAKYNSKIAAESRYWRADCYYRQEEYAKSRADYEEFLLSSGARLTKEFSLAQYNIGYSYFNEKNYAEAKTSFLKYINIEGNKKSATYIDALNRVGDCYFTAREFPSAQKYYTQAANTKQPGTDYSLFQQGFVEGLQKNYKQKVAVMKSLTENFPKSDYCDDALYEIGHSYMMMEDYDTAIGTFTNLYKKYPTSSQARKAMLQKGMLYDNRNQQNEAISTYKQVIASYPDSEEAATAMESLEKCYVQMGKVSEYTAYLKKIGKQNEVSVEKEDSLQYTSAERQYFYGNFAEATRSFEYYTTQYPTGKYIVPATNYLADCYYRTNKKSKAKTEYLKLTGNAQYAPVAVARVAEVAYDEQNYSEAIEYFKKLKNLAESHDEQLAAQLGVLRCSAFLSDYRGVVAVADEMITDELLDIDMVREVRYRRAKAYIAQSDVASALPDLRELSYETRHIYGAECNYLLSDFYYQQGKMDEAEKAILDFINRGTPHQYWLARSFVLLADVYISQKDDFQAKQYLLSLQENYTQDDSIQGMITERLAGIEKREHETIITDVNEELELTEQNETNE